MTVLPLLIPDFTLILIGHLLCRHTALNRTVWAPVDALAYHVLFPTLLFHAIVRQPLSATTLSSVGAAGLSLAAVGVALAWSWPHAARTLARLRRRPPPSVAWLRLHAAGAQVGFRFNSFVALALVERVVGPAGTPLLAVLIGLCVPLFNVAAVWPMHRLRQLAQASARGDTPSLSRELLRNPLIVATTAGLAANALGLSIPAWLEPTLTRMGAAGLALGLMAAGAGMQLGSLAQAKTLAMALLLQKHLLLPLLAVALAWAWGLDPTQTTVLLIFAALPTASSSYVLAARMGFDGGFVAALVTLSTVLGILSLTLALGPLRA